MTNSQDDGIKKGELVSFYRKGRTTRTVARVVAVDSAGTLIVGPARDQIRRRNSVPGMTSEPYQNGARRANAEESALAAWYEARPSNASIAGLGVSDLLVRDCAVNNDSPSDRVESSRALREHARRVIEAAVWVENHPHDKLAAAAAEKES